MCTQSNLCPNVLLNRSDLCLHVLMLLNGSDLCLHVLLNWTEKCCSNAVLNRRRIYDVGRTQFEEDTVYIYFRMYMSEYVII